MLSIFRQILYPMKFKILGLTCLLSLAAWSQPTFTAIVAGSVVDSVTGTGIPNYPVFVVDSSGSSAPINLTLFTDANGYYNDTLYYTVVQEYYWYLRKIVAQETG